MAAEEKLAALSQAAAAIGFAVEVLDAADISGAIRDDAALIAERIALIITKLEAPVEECSQCGGSGELHADSVGRGDPQDVVDYPCLRCHGSGAEPI